MYMHLLCAMILHRVFPSRLFWGPPLAICSHSKLPIMGADMWAHSRAGVCVFIASNGISLGRIEIFQCTGTQFSVHGQ